MRQHVYEDLPIAAFCERFDEIAGMAESVSFFTGWRGPTIDQVWVKSRVEPGWKVELPDGLYGAQPATVERHPIRGLDPAAATRQLGAVGRWYERLPHFGSITRRAAAMSCRPSCSSIGVTPPRPSSRSIRCGTSSRRWSR
jgi:xylitol oxidase